MPLDVATRRRGDVVIVAITGELDLETAPELQEQLTTLLEQGARRLVFDLAEMPFCDSTGLSVFVQTRNSCEELGGDVRLAAPPKAVQRVLELSGVTDALPLYASVDEALTC